MRHDKKILCRVGTEFEDYKVIEIWQSLAYTHEEKIDQYIRADIVVHIIDRLAELERDLNYSTGFAGRYTDNMTDGQEIQIEKDQILKDYGLDK